MHFYFPVLWVFRLYKKCFDFSMDLNTESIYILTFKRSVKKCYFGNRYLFFTCVLFGVTWRTIFAQISKHVLKEIVIVSLFTVTNNRGKMQHEVKFFVLISSCLGRYKQASFCNRC